MSLFLGMMIFLIGGFSIWCNFSFYSSFSIGFNAVALGCFGLISDITKLVSAKTFSESLIRPNSKSTALSGLLIWSITSTLSVVAGYGFLSGVLQSHENTQLKQSHVYESGLISVSNARSKVESLAQFADTSNADLAKQEKAVLEDELDTYLNQPAKNGQGIKWGTIGGRTGDCTNERSYYVKSYCPKIRALQANIKKQNEIIMGYLKYVSANSYLEKTSLKLADLSAGGGTIHAAFRDIGGLTGFSPQFVKVLVIGVLALVVEFSTSYFIYLSTSLFGRVDGYGYGDGEGQTTINEPYQKAPKIVGGSQFVVGQSLVNRAMIAPKAASKQLDRRFRDATKALTKTLINPKTGKLATKLSSSKYGINAWCKAHGGPIPNSLMKNWQAQWLEMGLIEPCKSSNKSDTYRIKE